MRESRARTTAMAEQLAASHQSTTQYRVAAQRLHSTVAEQAAVIVVLTAASDDARKFACLPSTRRAARHGCGKSAALRSKGNASSTPAYWKLFARSPTGPAPRPLNRYTRTSPDELRNAPSPITAAGSGRAALPAGLGPVADDLEAAEV